MFKAWIFAKLLNCEPVFVLLKKFKSIIVRFWYIYRSGEGFELFKKDSNRLGRSLRLIGDNYMHYSPEIDQKFEIIGKKYKMRRERDSNPVFNRFIYNYLRGLK